MSLPGTGLWREDPELFAEVSMEGIGPLELRRKGRLSSKNKSMVPAKAPFWHNSKPLEAFKKITLDCRSNRITIHDRCVPRASLWILGRRFFMVLNQLWCKAAPLQYLPKFVMFVTVGIAIAVPCRAQRGGSTGTTSRPSSGGAPSATNGSGAGAGANAASSPGVPTFGAPLGQAGTFPDQLMVSNFPALPHPQMVEDESCMPWDLSAIRGATVSVSRLEVPSNARGDFDKGCSAFKKKKYDEAEGHVRSAIGKYPNYAAAWVMLGQVMATQAQLDKANDACSHAMTIDPTYVPPYLCMADVAARDTSWGQLLDLSNRALGLNPVGDGYAYYYQALAFYQLRKFPDALKSASHAVEIDQQHHQTDLYFLLAQIDDAQGDQNDAIAQLKKYLKLNPDKDNAAVAKEYLTKLQAAPEQTASKAETQPAQ
jgi:TolA-binding protein